MVALTLKLQKFIMDYCINTTYINFWKINNNKNNNNIISIHSKSNKTQPTVWKNKPIETTAQQTKQKKRKTKKSHSKNKHWLPTIRLFIDNNVSSLSSDKHNFFFLFVFVYSLIKQSFLHVLSFNHSIITILIKYQLIISAINNTKIKMHILFLAISTVLVSNLIMQQLFQLQLYLKTIKHVIFVVHY